MPSSGPLTTLGRVIWALMLREIHTLYGDSRLGYLWAIIQTMFMVASLWALRELFGMHVPHGLSIAEYLLTGYLVWHMMETICEKCMLAVDGNMALLTFAQVTPVDIMLARTLVILATETVIFVLLVIVSNAIGHRFAVENVVMFLCSLCLAALLAMSIGFILLAFAVMWPTLKRIMPMVFRALFFVSGIFFSPTRLSKNLSDIFWWNPILQVIEMARNSISASYVDVEVSVPYLLLFFLFTMPLGLLLEKFTRRYHHYG